MSRRHRCKPCHKSCGCGSPSSPCANQEQGDLIVGGLLALTPTELGPQTLGVFAPINITRVEIGNPGGVPNVRSWILTTGPISTSLETIQLVSGASSTTSTTTSDTVYAQPFFDTRSRVLSQTRLENGCSIFRVEIWLINNAGVPVDPAAVFLGAPTGIMLGVFSGAPGLVNGQPNFLVAT